jgi:hypothetical protein
LQKLECFGPKKWTSSPFDLVKNGAKLGENLVWKSLRDFSQAAAGSTNNLNLQILFVGQTLLAC